MRSLPICFAHKSKFCVNSQLGLTLVELLTAMAIIPIILIAATNISLQAAQTAQATDVDSKAVAEMENVMSTIARITENGTPEKIVGGNTYQTESQPNNLSCSFDGQTQICHRLVVRIPNSNDARVFTYYDTSHVLTVCAADDSNTLICNPNETFNVSYNKSIRNPTGLSPFVYPFNGNENQVQINFQFLGYNNAMIQNSQVINLNGGNGIS